MKLLIEHKIYSEDKEMEKIIQRTTGIVKELPEEELKKIIDYPT